jgi:NADH-quinone oxidoreductase subunit L
MKCLDLICFFLFLGSMGKSAQLGLHVWLPDAMEGERNLNSHIYVKNTVKVINFWYRKRNLSCMSV